MVFFLKKMKKKVSFCRLFPVLQKKKCHFVEIARFLQKSLFLKKIFIRLKRAFGTPQKSKNDVLASYFWTFFWPILDLVAPWEYGEFELGETPKLDDFGTYRARGVKSDQFWTKVPPWEYGEFGPKNHSKWAYFGLYKTPCQFGKMDFRVSKMTF